MTEAGGSEIMFFWFVLICVSLDNYLVNKRGVSPIRNAEILAESECLYTVAYILNFQFRLVECCHYYYLCSCSINAYLIYLILSMVKLSFVLPANSGL